MDDEFKIDGLEGFQKALAGVVNRFPEEKTKELLKLGMMFQAEIKPLVPVDTGRLINSFSTQTIDANSAECGTDVEYAQAINDGHVMTQHFVSKDMLQAGGGKNWQKYNVDTTFESSVSSGSYVNDTEKLPITDPRVKGFTVHPQFVLGKHFMEDGFQNVQPKAEQELEKWVQQMLDKIGEDNNNLSNTFNK